MGINSQCYLPNDIQANDIIEAIAFLCGAKRIKMELSGGGFAASHDFDEVCDTPGKENKNHKIYVRPTHNIQYFTIEIAPTTCDGGHHTGDLFLYPQDAEGHPGRYCLYAGVSDFWKKIDRALVDMFGGEIDDNDCDSIDIDYKRRKPRKTNTPSDGEAWNEFQTAMLNLPKLFDFVK